MKVIECEQRSPEWFAARAGRVTASKIADLTARTKSGWGASRGNYLAELVAQRLTGDIPEGFTNAAMQWGTDMEPEARSAYQFMTDNAVTEVGFVIHPTIDASGCSPDGFVHADGMVEIKCPNTATHIDTLLGAPIADKYVKQMQWQMACCERAWCDFVSYDPRLPAHMVLFIQRVPRDDALIASLEHDVQVFLGEVDARVAALIARYGKAAA